jgi:hypothetical protein
MDNTFWNSSWWGGATRCGGAARRLFSPTLLGMKQPRGFRCPVYAAFAFTNAFYPPTFLEALQEAKQQGQSPARRIYRPQRPSVRPVRPYRHWVSEVTISAMLQT